MREKIGGREGRVRHMLVTGGGAAVYALLYALCSQIDETGFCRADEAVRRFLLALPAAFAVLLILFHAVLPLFDGKKGTQNEKPFPVFGAFFLIFLCYVPMFLIEYPGTFMYDTQAQTFQIATGEYSTHHPLLHTLLIRFCLSFYRLFQSYEKCAALYSLIQMVLLSGCFALICASVSRLRSRRAGYWTMAFFCLYPAHMAFASNCAKDVLFSGFFALFLAYSLEAVEQNGRKHTAGLIISGTLACLLRNNMMYAMAVWLIVLLFMHNRAGRLLICGALSAALAFGVNAGLQRMTDAVPGRTSEMLSVPAQQLARARLYAEDRFTDEERAQMDALLPNEAYKNYEPTLSNPIKNAIDERMMKENKGAVVKLWMDIGKKCPDVYLDAFLNLALPSLYPYSAYRCAEPYIETGMHFGVLSAPFGQPPIVQPGRFKALREALYEHIFSTGADDVPVLKWIFNSGLIYWLLLLFFLYSLYRGETARTAVLFLAVLLWGTYLLGPIMQGRYLYPFICALPLFAVFPVKKEIDINLKGDDEHEF